LARLLLLVEPVETAPLARSRRSSSRGDEGARRYRDQTYDVGVVSITPDFVAATRPAGLGVVEQQARNEPAAPPLLLVEPVETPVQD